MAHARRKSPLTFEPLLQTTVRASNTHSDLPSKRSEDSLWWNWHILTLDYVILKELFLST